MTSCGPWKRRHRKRVLLEVSCDVHLLLLMEFDEVASPPEIALVGKLVTATIQGLAHALTERSHSEGESCWVSALHPESRKKLENLRQSSSVVNGEKLIQVPKERSDNEKPV